MSKRQVKVECNGKTLTISNFSNYKEAIEQIRKKFKLPKSAMNNAEIWFFDEDGDRVNLDEESFNEEDAKKSKQWCVKVDPIGVEKNNNEIIKNILNELKVPIEKDINQYKNNLVVMCQKIMEQKMKEKDKKYEEELKKMEEEYCKELERVKNEAESETKTALDQVVEKANSIIDDLINKYDEESKTNVGLETDKKSGIIEKIISGLNLGKIQEIQNSNLEMLKECQKDFNNFSEK